MRSLLGRALVMLTMVGLAPASLAASGSPGRGLHLIPEPRQVRRLPGRLNLGPSAQIVLGEAEDEEARFVAETFRSDLKELAGLQVPLVPAPGRAAARRIMIGVWGRSPVVREIGQPIGLQPDAELGDQGYVLRVTPRFAIVTANAAPGVFYGVQTLRQLLTQERGRGRWFLPAVYIRDWPAMRYRGISDDISRGPIPTVEYMKHQIRTLAYFKLNVLSWYMEHPFKYEKHPGFAPPDAVTPEEAREIVAYARRYRVELIPEQQSFAHGWQILRHEQYAALRETGDIFCPVKEGTYRFFGDLYGELVRMFPSPLFHVGCDETYGLGEGPSKELAQEIGVGRVYLQHLIRLRDLLRGHGKRMLFWGDMALQHPELLAEIPKDMVVANWGYAGIPSFENQLQPYAEVGLDQFVCPGVSNWSQIFPDLDNALVNIHSFVRDGQKYGAMGMLNTTWDDDGETLFEHTWYGVVYSAACAWQPGAAAPERFGASFDWAFYGRSGQPTLSQAIRLLGHAPTLLGRPQTTDSLFWEDPFAGQSSWRVPQLLRRAAQLQQAAAMALDLIARSRPTVKRQRGNLEAVAFAARRYRWLANKLLVAERVARRYNELYEGDRSARLASQPKVIRELERLASALRQLRDGLAALKEEYTTLWLRECRPAYLPNILARYDNLIASLEAKAQQLQQAQTTYRSSGVLPEPAALGFPEKRLPQRQSKLQPADLPEARSAAWWNPQWHYRLPLVVRNGEDPKENYPVEVELDFARLLQQAGGEGHPDPQSLRVVVCSPDWQAIQELPCQFIPPSSVKSPISILQSPSSGVASVVWIAEGKMAPQETRCYYLYFDTVENGPKPEGSREGFPSEVRTWPDGQGEGFWIENDRCRLLLSPEGGHLYVWEVKALGKDVTFPGRSGWSGFNDIGGYREAFFRWSCLAQGPLLVRYHGVGPEGAEITLNVFAGAGWVEIFLNFLVGYYWAFDAVENMAADQPQPGTAIFSNGAREPVPASYENRQVVQPNTTWSAKTRGDGLTIGLITPDNTVLHLVGPGGGWGGVGIERGGAASHFVTLADVCGDPEGVLEVLRATLSSRTSPHLLGGLPQKLIDRPQDFGRASNAGRGSLG